MGTHEAACDTENEDVEKAGTWCVSQCPEGYQEKNAKTCVQLCSGKFPVEGMVGMCGTDPGEVVVAVAQMATMVTNGAVKSYLLISEMKEEGRVDAERLSGTINAFVDMGKPFARPQCPEEGVD